MEKGISRRDFLKLATYGTIVGGVLDTNYEKHLVQVASMLNPAACAVSAHPRHPGNPTLDVLVLNEPATKSTNRLSPRVRTERNVVRADWLGHYNRPGHTGLAGLDFAPVGSRTEIVPIAGGVVSAVLHNDPDSGNVIHVYHGLGFASWYGHLEDVYVKPTNIVNRNTVIGIMGDKGSGGQGIVHLHLSLYGLLYTEHLKLNNVQKYPTKTILSPNIIDPEELSVLGRHKPLPYMLQEDFRLDWEFNLRVKEARKQVNEYLTLFPHINRSRFSPQVNSVINKYFLLADLALDRDIADLYNEVTKENPSISRNDADKIKKSLEDIMANTLPRFTAPIKESR